MSAERCMEPCLYTVSEGGGLKTEIGRCQKPVGHPDPKTHWPQKLCGETVTINSVEYECISRPNHQGSCRAEVFGDGDVVVHIIFGKGRDPQTGEKL